MELTRTEAADMLHRAANYLYNRFLYGFDWNGLGDSAAVDLLDSLTLKLSKLN